MEVYINYFLQLNTVVQCVFLVCATALIYKLLELFIGGGAFKWMK